MDAKERDELVRSAEIASNALAAFGAKVRVVLDAPAHFEAKQEPWAVAGWIQLRWLEDPCPFKVQGVTYSWREMGAGGVHGGRQKMLEWAAVDAILVADRAKAVTVLLMTREATQISRALADRVLSANVKQQPRVVENAQVVPPKVSGDQPVKLRAWANHDSKIWPGQTWKWLAAGTRNGGRAKFLRNIAEGGVPDRAQGIEITDEVRRRVAACLADIDAR